MLTEEEAKTKWCPMTRFHNSGHHVYHNKPCGDNGAAAHAGSANCIASDCAMWRWSRHEELDDSGAYIRKGYCGVAGRPEVG